MLEDGRYGVEFRPPWLVPADTIKVGDPGKWVQDYLTLLEDQVRLYPENSNEYFFWDDDEAPGKDESRAA